MEGSIRLSAEERKMLLSAVQHETPCARRANIVLLAAKGWSYRQIREAVFASFDLIAKCLAGFVQRGVAAILGEQSEPTPKVPAWLKRISRWLTHRTPQDFGFFRARWSCGLLAETLAWETGLRLSAETIRRGLKWLGWVWRRPRPVVGPTDPEYDAKVQQIRNLLAALPRDETALFQDEVDVNLNPKIGSCWMPRGQQAEVVTPGNNEKRHVAGSLHWRTGTLVVSQPATRRNTGLFLQHLDDLRRALRGFRKIHVICDNAPFHTSAAVRQYLVKWRHRIQLHFLPKYAPETNPIERVWWHFHETITRNHRCQTLAELLQQSYDWFRHSGRFYFEMRTVFPLAA